MAEQFGIRLSVSPADLAKSINRAITQINTVGGLRKIKIDADTSEFESAIKRIKSEIASITGSSTSKIELGTSRADGQITLDELTAFRKAEEALANPVGMAAVQAEFNKTAEIVKNLTTAVSAFKTEYSSIGGVNSSGNTNGLIDVNAISERIKTAVSSLNITKPVEIPVAFKGVQEAIATLQQQVDGTVINFGNSALNGTSTNAGETVSNAVKQAAEQTTESLKQEANALSDVNNKLSERHKLYLKTGDVASSIKSGTSSKNVVHNYLNGEEISRIQTVNYEQQRKEMDKTAASAASLKSELESVKTTYSNLNVPVPIKSEDISKLDVEYESIKNRINDLQNSTSRYNEQSKAEIAAQIKGLKQLAEVYREANSGGTTMRKRDIATVKSVSSNVLNSFVSGISDSRVLSAVEGDIARLKQALDGVTDRTKLNEFLNQFDILKAKVKALNAEIKSVSDTTKHIGDGIKALDKISGDSALYRNRGLNTAQYDSLMNSVSALKNEYLSLQKSLTNDTSAENLAKVKEQLAVVDSKLKETVNDAASLKREFGSIKIDDNTARKVAQTHAMIVETMRVNTRAMGQINTASGSGLTFGEEFRRLNDELVKSPELVDRINSQVRVLQSNIKTLGIQGATFFDELKQKASKFLKWTAMTLVITKTRMYLRQLFTTVYDLDTALVDLKKTFKGTESELNDFYFESNKLAKQMGVTTAEIIKQGAAWSRLGYSSNETMKKMAEMSAMFAAISPDMDTETAQNGLVSIMKAFDISPEDTLDGILSKVNVIGNTAATSNGEIVEMLQKSSSAMKEANNTLEETIALETAAVEITRDSASVGMYRANRTVMCA